MLLPLLQALGYNIFDETKVIVDSASNIGKEAIDYKICLNGIDYIIIKCLPKGLELSLSLKKLCI